MLYAKEIGIRLPPNEHYMDYTGSSLYCTSILKAVFDDLQVSARSPPLIAISIPTHAAPGWAARPACYTRWFYFLGVVPNQPNHGWTHLLPLRSFLQVHRPRV
jgi:hypothetical protein